MEETKNKQLIVEHGVARISFTKKRYNENAGLVEEVDLEVEGDNLNKCQAHFDYILETHDKPNFWSNK